MSAPSAMPDGRIPMKTENSTKKFKTIYTYQFNPVKKNKNLNAMKTTRNHRGILTNASLASLAAAMLLSVAACDNKDYSIASPFDNVVYLDAALQKDVTNFTFNRVTEKGQQKITAQLSQPTGSNVNVNIKVDPTLVATYNARMETDYTLLDPKYYTLSAEQAVIPQGKTVSAPVTVDFTNLTELTIDAGYLLPVTISQATGGVGILDGSKTICYVIRRSSAITTAVSLKDNYFEVPGFDKGSPTAKIVNGLKQLTYEAIIRVNDFKYGADTKDICTIMGIEQYCLFRLGDAGFPLQQLQFAAQENKIPNADNSKLLLPNEWYHVAVVYDTEARSASIYVDGHEQSHAEDYGTGEVINLGMQERGKQFMFKIGHSYGEPDDMTRQLDGEICEVRIWSTARTQEEIYKNMYNIEDPERATGLCAYWKFNEGEGDIAKDHSGHGNDAKAYNKAVLWPSGIEVTQKNKE